MHVYVIVHNFQLLVCRVYGMSIFTHYVLFTICVSLNEIHPIVIAARYIADKNYNMLHNVVVNDD